MTKIKQLIITLIIGLFLFQIPHVVAQAPQSEVQLVQQGQKAYNLGRYSEAIKLLQRALQLTDDKKTQSIILSNLSLAYQQLGDWDAAQKQITASLKLQDSKSKVYAQSLDIQSRLFYVSSQPEAALKNLQQAAEIYAALGDEAGSIGNIINQAQVLQALGLYQQAYGRLENIQQRLSVISDSSIAAKGYLSLGNVLRAIGELKQSQNVLQKGLTVSEQSEVQNALILSLANTFRAKANLERERTTTRSYNNISWQCNQQSIPDNAVESYQDAALQYKQLLAAPLSPSVRVQTQINYLSLLAETGETSAAQSLWRDIKFYDLPSGRQAVYTKINGAKNLACISGVDTSLQQIDNLLGAAVEDAKQLQDERALSYALGNRGGFYEYLAQKNKDYLTASQNLTKQALLLTQPIMAPDIAYQWEWQMGRLLAAQGNNSEAVKFYKAAVESLKTVRSDLLAINSDVQFSYRDNVESVYRGLVDLLLRTNNKDNIAQALENIDALQLAELQNFLRCNFLQLQPANQSKEKNIGANTAFIYPIILEDRLEVIYKLPGKRIERYVHPVKRAELQQTVQQLRSAILTRNVSKMREKSQTVYNWLIKPLEETPETPVINTLVFILDGELRNIPMSILYDTNKKEYLIQKNYALALLPNSQLFNLYSQPLQNPKVLAGGVSEKQENIGEETRTFNQLNIEEIYEIAKLLPSKLLINEQFTQQNLSKQLQTQEFPIVHIATHGNFSSNPEDTYLLAYKQLIKAKDFNNLLQNQINSNTIKLLVLSACKTAEGDHRAILGLAGLAVRAGADSTLSTLWQVNDNSTSQLMTQFYTELKKGGVSKAEALHRAQKALLAQPEYQNPYHWAPYILVGNWL
jgi:CHAT domain-containing protein